MYENIYIFRTECFCGENPPPSASKVADTSCNMKCPGDARQLCGGYFMMNVYQTGAVSESHLSTLSHIIYSKIELTFYSFYRI